MPCFRPHQGIGEAHHMLPLRFTQTQVQTTQKGYKTGRMVYNELEQGGILSDLRFGLALLAYTDILLCSIWSFYKIRQTPVHNPTASFNLLLCSKSWQLIHLES